MKKTRAGGGVDTTKKCPSTTKEDLTLTVCSYIRQPPHGIQDACSYLDDAEYDAWTDGRARIAQAGRAKDDWQECSSIPISCHSCQSPMLLELLIILSKFHFLKSH